MDEAPAYCMNCNRAIAVGPTCDDCATGPCQHDDTYLDARFPGGEEYEICEDCGASWKTGRIDTS